jgi:hypothetical protein
MPKTHFVKDILLSSRAAKGGGGKVIIVREVSSPNEPWPWPSCVDPLLPRGHVGPYC